MSIGYFVTMIEMLVVLCLVFRENLRDIYLEAYGKLRYKPGTMYWVTVNVGDEALVRIQRTWRDQVFYEIIPGLEKSSCHITWFMSTGKKIPEEDEGLVLLANLPGV